MPGVDRRLLQNFEWVLPLLAFSLAGLGIVNLASAGSNEGTTALRQLVWLGGGVLVLLAVLVPDYRRLERYTPFIYAGGVLLLIAVLLVGPVIKGSQRWLLVGPLRLQPSELFKLIILFAFARLLARRQSTRPLTFLEMAVPGLVIAVPAVLILRQPDLGTAALIALGGATFVCLAPIRLRTFVILGLGGLAAVVLAWTFYLHDYQKERVFVFLHPEEDPLGSAYHVIQSQIAVGSGGVWGKGWQQGSQTQLDFLPEQQTDFVFSVLGEEWGFVGAALVLVLYVGLMVRGLMIARASKDLFGTYLAVGLVGMFFWAGTINVGMVLGLFPVVGVPLPLLSYGGSSLITCMVAIGLLMNISMRRYVF